MARDELVTLNSGSWQEITVNDATSITIIHRSGAECLIKATTGAAPGVDDRSGFVIASGRNAFHDGFVKKAITDLSHTAGVDRVFAYPLGGTCSLWVEHN